MKQNKVLILTIGLILLVSISGCQNVATPAAPATQSSNLTPLPPANPTLESYPSSADQSNLTNTPYPAPADAVVSPSAYPAPQDGSTIAWADAEQLLLDGKVTGVILTQSLDVTLTLNTGQTVKTTVPTADAVKNAISACGDLCRNISITTQ
jgi:hypothetical protein